MKLELSKKEEVRRILVSYADETEGQWGGGGGMFSRTADFEWTKGTKRNEDAERK
jgi:hypothetical protein